ncbi:acyl-CoA dehydrogenase family protein [Streptomyces lunaelactis]|uniref:acyl-CoA dehydrogenase family protein n=3 Tax=Streptomyces lunaelactis TaxID=1535768 RepID=UPI001584BC80|nr:acyl-CoA dehydrogenase family protein [Streptomyces lunaelactis]NUK03395.1 acyl-CoA dehydrogenase family protein [Streptomyces lunaelactis]NUK19089.1 acyl-CoA dehydrogenase family protein [Streptomyces lunaelactis]NUK38011.1 acyl-CoA dehydrogenase family protein [Streptomyces lunaelactis]NUK43281.1 acyl-CoA dehydrogenase family protein [Streptomyces lunaelactis]NUL31824.1 acyl-CoA dehydrogenase family protein [Streptomyces lunaelactis]
MTATTERTGTAERTGTLRTVAAVHAPDTEEAAPGLRWQLAEQLDQRLGDPNAAGPLSYARAASEDAAEEFPAEACELLGALGVHHYYIPAEYGGSLTGFPQLLEIVRTIARRDLTTAVGHGKTFLGAVCVWVAEDRAGAERLASLVRAGEPVSLGLTERTHGSDLMAGEVVAERTEGGYLITGEKWLINNVTRGRLVCLLARTAAEGGPRGFSLLLVDKNELPEDSYRTLPKVHTLGIRGADISGIAFDRAPVGTCCLVGREGEGPEVVLKALQITRSLCTALSLGAADHGLRVAHRFAAERELYGRKLLELPAARRTLAETYADLLAMEALSTVAARSIHTLPDELSVTSAVAKYLVPTVVDDILNRLRGVLGARAILTDHYAHGRFQKLERDHRIVGIFDGNTMVNLYALTAQFRTLARYHPVHDREPDAVAATFSYARELPGLRPGQLSLLARRGSTVLGSLPTAAEVLGAQASRDPELGRAAALARTLATAADQLHTRMRAARPVPGGAPVESFDLARGYSMCFAAACCLGVWQHNRRLAREVRTAELWTSGLWLEAVLARLVDRLEQAVPGITGPQPRPPAAYDAELESLYERLLGRLTAQYEAGELFSLLPGRIAEGPPC